MSAPRKIAIVGGGISGIACSWTLKDHNCYVDLYEADNRLGGHANSVPFKGNSRKVDVDTGFIAMDETTYHFCGNWKWRRSQLTCPLECQRPMEYSNGGAILIFAEDILLDNHVNNEDELTEANCIPSTHNSRLEPIGEYLKRERYSAQFITYFLMPMVAAPWCIDPDEFGRTFPAQPLIRFMSNHRLLDTVSTTLRWRSFRGGSKTYVDAFRRKLSARHRIHEDTKIEKVEQHENSASIEFSDGTCKTFDHVVLAIHANQALTLLGSGATEMQHMILSSFKTSRNICYLHSDETLLPVRPSARVAWNCFLNQQVKGHSTELRKSYLSSKAHDHPLASSSTISLTFDMNKLQNIPMPGEFGSPGRVLVTMNPSRIPHAPQSSQVYYHPLITSESITMSRYLNNINGVRSISFAGAWMGFGFHEDGFASGAHVARMLIEGREKTGPLDLISRVDGGMARQSSYWLKAIKICICAVQKML